MKTSSSTVSASMLSLVFLILLASHGFAQQGEIRIEANPFTPVIQVKSQPVFDHCMGIGTRYMPPVNIPCYVVVHKTNPNAAWHKANENAAAHPVKQRHQRHKKNATAKADVQVATTQTLHENKD